MVVDATRIYTDGSCSVASGCGGWATLFIVGDEIKVLSGHDKSTTNNRMELRAVIEAYRKIAMLAAKQPKRMAKRNYTIHSDSAYVVNAINEGWLVTWSWNHWQTADGKDVSNVDMWKELQVLMKMVRGSGAGVSIVKVKGHSGDPLNSMADRIAVSETEKAKAELAKRELRRSRHA